LASQLHQYQCG